MKTVAEVIGVSRSNLIERMRERAKKRIGRPPLPDDNLVAEIKAVIAELPTYGPVSTSQCANDAQTARHWRSIRAVFASPLSPLLWTNGAFLISSHRWHTEAVGSLAQMRSLSLSSCMCRAAFRRKHTDDPVRGRHHRLQHRGAGRHHHLTGHWDKVVGHCSIEQVSILAVDALFKKNRSDARAAERWRSVKVTDGCCQKRTR
jgi:hypothetical protein